MANTYTAKYLVIGLACGSQSWASQSYFNVIRTSKHHDILFFSNNRILCYGYSCMFPCPALTNVIILYS